MAVLVPNNLAAELHVLDDSTGAAMPHEPGVQMHSYASTSGYATESTPKSTRLAEVVSPARASGGSSSSSPLHYPLTGQIEVPGIRKPKPLLAMLKRIREIEPQIRKKLIAAEEFLLKKNYPDAITSLEESVVETNDFPNLQCFIWLLLGDAQLSVGQYKKASVCHMHHLAYCRELNNFKGMTKAECNLGIAYMKLGLLKLAGRCFLQYLQNCRTMDDDMSAGFAFSNLGMLSKTLAIKSFETGVQEGDRAKAMEDFKTHLRRAIAYFEQHLEIVEQHGDLAKQARGYGNLGYCYEMMKQYPQAIFCHNKRLEIVRTIGDRTSECCTLCNLGNCFRSSGKLEEAMEYYLLNLELTRAIGNRDGEIKSLLNLGTTCELLNKLEKAIEWHTLYLSMMVENGDLSGEVRGFSTLAGLYEESGQIVKAHEYYKKLVKVFQKTGDRNAHATAVKYLEYMKQVIKEEKQRNKRFGTLRKKRRGSISGSSTLPRNFTFTMRPKDRKDKMSTWTVSQRKEFQKQAALKESASFTSGATFQNPTTSNRATREDFLTMATDPGRVYHSEGITQTLFENEAITSFSVPEPQPEGFPPVYHLDEVMLQTRRLPEVPPSEVEEENETHANLMAPAEHGENGSITDYESLSGDPPVHIRVHPARSRSFLGSQRHIEELQRVERDFTGPVAELGLDGTDKEWEQWLQIQDDDALSQVGSLNVDMSAFTNPPKKRRPFRPAISAPQSMEVYRNCKKARSQIVYDGPTPYGSEVQVMTML